MSDRIFLGTNILVYAYDRHVLTEDLDDGQKYNNVLVKNPFR